MSSAVSKADFASTVVNTKIGKCIIGFKVVLHTLRKVHAKRGWPACAVKKRSQLVYGTRVEYPGWIIVARGVANTWGEIRESLTERQGIDCNSYTTAIPLGQ